MKALFAAVVIALSSLVVANCSKRAVEGAPEEAAPEEARPSGSLILATTTSTYDTGLLDHLLSVFKQQTGITAKTVAVGTGEALELGRRGEADVLLVHAPKEEEAFIAGGYGINRRAVMHNDFVIVGPPGDPAKLSGMTHAALAFAKILSFEVPWISRGDRSGTHIKEMELWSATAGSPQGSWFTETGQGMAATLRVASERQAYTLSDRGTFVSTQNLDLKILVEGDSVLANPYHVIEVKNARSNAEGAKRLADFFVAKATQEMIGKFTIHGQQFFIPDALN